MAAEEFEKTVQLGAGVSKLDESLQELDEVVERYGQVADKYDQGDLEGEKLQETVEQVVQGFEQVFSDQNWIGKSTANIIEKDIDGEYEKFIGYQGLVRAADQIHREKDEDVSMQRPKLQDSPVSEEAEDILDTWNRFLETYSSAINSESVLRQISAEEGAEEEGLDPYAFETAFMNLEEEYDRVSDLNEFVQESYH